MNGFRFTLRFRADNEAERHAAEYLKSLKHEDTIRKYVESQGNEEEKNFTITDE